MIKPKEVEVLDREDEECELLSDYLGSNLHEIDDEWFSLQQEPN